MCGLSTSWGLNYIAGLDLYKGIAESAWRWYQNDEKESSTMNGADELHTIPDVSGLKHEYADICWISNKWFEKWEIRDTNFTIPSEILFMSLKWTLTKHKTCEEFTW